MPNRHPFDAVLFLSIPTGMFGCGLPLRCSASSHRASTTRRVNTLSSEATATNSRVEPCDLLSTNTATSELATLHRAKPSQPTHSAILLARESFSLHGVACGPTWLLCVAAASKYCTCTRSSRLRTGPAASTAARSVAGAGAQRREPRGPRGPAASQHLHLGLASHGLALALALAQSLLVTSTSLEFSTSVSETAAFCSNLPDCIPMGPIGRSPPAPETNRSGCRGPLSNVCMVYGASAAAALQVLYR